MSLAFIGSGKMARALMAGLFKSGLRAPGQVIASDPYPAARESLTADLGVKAVADNLEAVRFATEAVILCAKPQDIPALLPPLREALEGKLLVSIAAGLTLETLAELAGPACRLVRVMPNTPALVGAGASAYAPGANATAADVALVHAIFESVGLAVPVKENLLDAVTGVSGSGPAYVCLMIEALADGGVLMGLPRDLSQRLAAQTLLGAARMVLESGVHPAQLREQVTSPGGTTAAALEQLEQRGLRAALLSAVRAATERSRELA